MRARSMPFRCGRSSVPIYSLFSPSLACSQFMRRQLPGIGLFHISGNDSRWLTFRSRWRNNATPNIAILMA